jgi:hypothetical protein
MLTGRMKAPSLSWRLDGIDRPCKPSSALLPKTDCFDAYSPVVAAMHPPADSTENAAANSYSFVGMDVGRPQNSPESSPCADLSLGEVGCIGYMQLT